MTPDEFASSKERGLGLGFRHVESGPLVRSSYHAESQVPGRGKIEPSLLVPLAGGERL